MTDTTNPTLVSGPGSDLAEEAAGAPPARSRGRAIAAALACAVCMGLGLAPLFVGTFPLFLQPVSLNFGWGASVFPQAIMVAGLSSALSGPIVGRFIDAFGVRRVLLPGLAVWAGSLFMLSAIGGSVPLLYMVSVVMGVSAAACGPVALAKVVAGWFDRQRGLALSLVLGAAPAVSTALMLFIAQYLIANHGWRMGYSVMAGLVVLVAMPVCFLFLREAPNAKPAIASAPVSLDGVAPWAAFRSRAFITVMAASMLICASANAVVGHFIPWSMELNIGAASLALTVFSLVGPLGSLLAGAAADRASHPRMLVPLFALPLAGVALLFAGGNGAAVLALALIGGGFSAVAGLAPFFTARYFGLAHASTIFGAALGLLTLSLGLGPVLLGVARDAMGAYTPAVPFIVGCMIAAVALSATFPRYPAPPGGPRSPE